MTVDEVLKPSVPWLFPELGSFFWAAMKLEPKIRVWLLSVLVRLSR